MGCRNGYPTLLVIVLLVLLAGCGPKATALVATGVTTIPPTVAAQSMSVRETFDIQTRARDGMPMVYVPAGQFQMGLGDVQVDLALRGCNDTQDNCQRDWFQDERPAHRVALDAFWIDQAEVTNRQFATFLDDQGNQSEMVTDAEFAEWLVGHRRYSPIYEQTEGQVYWLEPGQYGLLEEVDGEFRPRTGYADFAVIEISWYGARAYCDWAGGRLPSEAEWEYAARGPESRLFTWGDTFDGGLVNYCDASCSEKWRDKNFDDGIARWGPVGSYPEGATWCGALDMTGNVWEWVHDWYGRGYYGRSPVENPQGPETGDLRVRRGGSWYEESWNVRTTARRGEYPSSLRTHWVGFRCVVSAETQG